MTRIEVLCVLLRSRDVLSPPLLPILVNLPHISILLGWLLLTLLLILVLLLLSPSLLPSSPLLPSCCSCPSSPSPVPQPLPLLSCCFPLLVPGTEGSLIILPPHTFLLFSSPLIGQFVPQIQGRSSCSSPSSLLTFKLSYTPGASLKLYPQVWHLPSPCSSSWSSPPLLPPPSPPLLHSPPTLPPAYITDRPRGGNIS